MEMIFEQPLTWLAVEILLPMIPAFMLFWSLPSKGEASGILRGMEFKFGGAFAGYFGLLVLLFSLGPQPPKPPPQPPQWQSWRLNGTVGFEYPADASQIPSVKLWFDPPTLNINQDGTFHADFVIKHGPMGKKLAFPSLHVSLPNQSETFTQYTIPLDPSKPSLGKTLEPNIDYKDHEIELPPIVLHRIKAYSPSDAN